MKNSNTLRGHRHLRRCMPRSSARPSGHISHSRSSPACTRDLMSWRFIPFLCACKVLQSASGKAHMRDPSKKARTIRCSGSSEVAIVIMHVELCNVL